MARTASQPHVRLTQYRMWEVFMLPTSVNMSLQVSKEEFL